MATAQACLPDENASLQCCQSLRLGYFDSRNPLAWPLIGKHLSRTIALASEYNHEIGLHAWDHHAWQRHSESWSVAEQREQTRLGMECLNEIVEQAVDCSAAAGWRANQHTIDAKQPFSFRYNSDCRGHSIFRPLLADGQPGIPQIPVTLPTYDEVVGQDVDQENYNDYILSQISPENLNVYTIHAEVEGIVLNEQFERLLDAAAKRGIRFVPLGNLLPDAIDSLPLDQVICAELAGREGWLGWQESTLTRMPR